jgi:hypothetical protein
MLNGIIKAITIADISLPLHRRPALTYILNYSIKNLCSESFPLLEYHHKGYKEARLAHCTIDANKKEIKEEKRREIFIKGSNRYLNMQTSQHI